MDRYLQHIDSEYPETHWDTLGIRITRHCSDAVIYCQQCDWTREKPQKHWFGTELLNDKCLVCGFVRENRTKV